MAIRVQQFSLLVTYARLAHAHPGSFHMDVADTIRKLQSEAPDAGHRFAMALCNWDASAYFNEV